MGILVGVTKLKKSFGARPLFDGLSFSIEDGDRIGLIGPNGAGKSTLLKILASVSTPDEGDVSFRRGIRIGYLEQVPSFRPGLKVFEALMEGALDPDDWQSLSQAQELMSKLSLNEGARGEMTLVDDLSGGWKKRVALARELMKQPDLLLLDEPTNHLDVESILWLEKFLAESRFAVLTITHDRLFLQRVSTRILELDRRNPNGLLSIKGSYADYLTIKEDLLAGQERREVVLKNTLRRETEWLRQGAKARTTKQQARIKGAGELKAQVEELEVKNLSRVANMAFQSTERSPKRLIEAKNISKTYDSRNLFEHLNLLLAAKTRIGLLGANGCGKSTLIRILLGQEKPDSGTVELADQLKVAYFEQNRERLDPSISTAKTLCPQGDYVSYRGNPVHIRSYLDRFLFGPDQMDIPVAKLSGGEQSRLLLARLMLEEANLLVLDEPTNDLDMATLNVLEECLVEFPGAVLLVTHDRYFMDNVATKIMAFGPGNGELVTFEGLLQWEAWHDELDERQAKAARAASVAASATKTVTKPKLSYNEQRELEGMEARIKDAEREIERLSVESGAPATLASHEKMRAIAEQMHKAQSLVEALYARWSELES